MKRFWIMETTSLACLALMYALFTYMYQDAGVFPSVPPFTQVIVFKIYLVDTGFILLLLAYEHLTADWEPASYLIVDILCRYTLAVITGYCTGPFIGLFGYDLRNAAVTAGFLLPVFVITYFVTYTTVKDYADTINKSILRNRGK